MSKAANGNGIQSFKKGDDLPELPTGLSDDIPVLSRFGFKVVLIDGKYYWEAASEEDFRASEALRLGIKAEDVNLGSCKQTGPRTCEAYYCGNGYNCSLLYNPQGKYYYCSCA